MYIQEGTIVGYKWSLYYGGTLIHEDDDIFEEEWEAKQYGEEAIDDKIAEWNLDGAWHPENGDSREDFDVVIEDVVEEEE